MSESQLSPQEEVLTDVIAVADQHPDMTLDELKAELEPMHNYFQQSGNAGAVQVVNSIWNRVQVLRNQTEQAMNVAIAAKTAAIELRKQRDETIEEFMDLEEALVNLDFSETRLELALDEMQNLTWETIQYECYVSACPACDITNGLVVTHDVAEQFHQILVGEASMPEPFAKELAEFLDDFVSRVNDAMAVQDE